MLGLSYLLIDLGTKLDFNLSVLHLIKSNVHGVRINLGHQVPSVWLSFPLAKCGWLGVMFLKRLVVYEDTYAKTATSQIGTLQSARRLN